MVWKKKEKDLSLEDAIALAKGELAPFWIGVPPLFAGVAIQSDYVLFPLDPQFSKLSWLILCLDMTDYDGESLARYAKEWHRRYSPHQLGILMIVCPSYQYLKTKDRLERFLERFQLPVSAALDIQDTLFRSLAVHSLPKALLFKGQKRYFEFEGESVFSSCEEQIQHYLRSLDPGLPLLPILHSTEEMPMDTGRLEFGFQNQIEEDLKWPGPGFKLSSDPNLRIGHFLRSPGPLKEASIGIQGIWTQTEEGIETSDSKAAIGFNCRGTRISLVAQSLTRPYEGSLVTLEINGETANSTFLGDHAFLDETGSSAVRLGHVGVYQLLHHLPAVSDGKPLEVWLRFGQADQVPIRLYGVRMGRSRIQRRQEKEEEPNEG